VICCTLFQCGSMAPRGDPDDVAYCRNVPKVDFLQPNLFKTVFQTPTQASVAATSARRCQHDQWLADLTDSFDHAPKHVRKRILQEFLKYVMEFVTCGMEDTFRHQAVVFLTRAEAWFNICLPNKYAVSTILLVFDAYLRFGELTFVEHFFESGSVVQIVAVLSIDFDCSDAERFHALNVLESLLRYGREWKERLCDLRLLDYIGETAGDCYRWETLKQVGRVLVEAFRANPKHQSAVVNAILGLLREKQYTTQRIGIQCIISILGESGDHNPHLKQEEVHREIVNVTVRLLEFSDDLRVKADAYCLLTRLAHRYNCDALLYDLARRQLITETEQLSIMIRLEVEAHEAEQEVDEMPNEVVEQMMKMLKRKGIEGTAREKNAAFREEFVRENGAILHWGLLLFLCRRSAEFCREMVRNGLSELLLASLLDTTNTIRQEAAFTELCRLRKFSPKAEQIVSATLGEPELVHCSDLVELKLRLTPPVLRRCRFRLRNMRHWRGGSAMFGADEHDLTQQLIDKEVAPLLGAKEDVEKSAKPVFLTEDPNAKEDPEAGDAEEKEDMAITNGEDAGAGEEGIGRGDDDIPRLSGLYDVRRVPPRGPEEEYHVILPPIDIIPFCGSLASLVFDPLETTADEQSALYMERKDVDQLGKFRSPRQPVDLAAMARGPKAPRKTQPAKPPLHLPDISHLRAMALRRPIQPSVGARDPGSKRARARPESRGQSEATDVSVRLGEWPIEAQNSMSMSAAMEESNKFGGISGADTSVGQDMSMLGSYADGSLDAPTYQQPVLRPIQLAGCTDKARDFRLEEPRKRLLMVDAPVTHDCSALHTAAPEEDAEDQYKSQQQALGNTRIRTERTEMLMSQLKSVQMPRHPGKSRGSRSARGAGTTTISTSGARTSR